MEELSETCRVSFQISVSSRLYYKTFVTMHGHINVKFSYECFQNRYGMQYMSFISQN